MRPPLRISTTVRAKLQSKHDVSEREIEQCFDNKCGLYLIDDREDNKTDPETLWFLAETNKGRVLKVCFMFIDGNVHIKTAYEPNEDEVKVYETYGK